MRCLRRCWGAEMVLKKAQPHVPPCPFAATCAHGHANYETSLQGTIQAAPGCRTCKMQAGCSDLRMEPPAGHNAGCAGLYDGNNAVTTLGCADCRGLRLVIRRGYAELVMQTGVPPALEVHMRRRRSLWHHPHRWCSHQVVGGIKWTTAPLWRALGTDFREHGWRASREHE